MAPGCIMQFQYETQLGISVPLTPIRIKTTDIQYSALAEIFCLDTLQIIKPVN